MKHRESLRGSASPAGSSEAGVAHDAAGARRLHSHRSFSWLPRSTSATMALFLGLTVLSLNGCIVQPNNRLTENGTTAPMDTLLLSDVLRFYLDGEMEVDRGISDCYGGGCVQTDGERILIKVPEFYVFAGHHDDHISAREDTIENRNGIMIGDVSLGTKDLPDIPDFASKRTITGYGGWGEYHGFDSLYFGFERSDRPQRVVEASLGGYASEGNPLRGPLTWTGGAVAVDYSVITEDRVLVGDSELTVYLNERHTAYLGRDEYLVRVDITDLEDVGSGNPYDDMTWRNIPLRDGGFETFSLKGQFFGPDHEEVGGVFERDEIIGAFGATREEAPDSN